MKRSILKMSNGFWLGVFGVVVLGLGGCSHAPAIRDVPPKLGLRTPTSIRAPADLSYRFEMRERFAEKLSQDGSAKEVYQALNVEEETLGNVSTKSWDGKFSVTKTRVGKRWIYAIQPVTLSREDLLELVKLLNIKSRDTHYAEATCPATLYRLGRLNIATAEQEKGQVCDPNLIATGIDLAVAWHSSAFPSGADFSYYFEQKKEMAWRDFSGSIQFQVELDGDAFVKGTFLKEKVAETVIFRERGEMTFYTEGGFLLRSVGDQYDHLKVFKIKEEHWPTIRSRLERYNGKVFINPEYLYEVGEISPAGGQAK